METDNIKELSLSIDTLKGSEIVDKLNEIFNNCNAELLLNRRIKVSSLYFNDILFINKLIKGGLVLLVDNMYVLYSNKAF